MTKPRWKFKELRPSDMKADPIEQEFFRNDEAVSAADSLVREAIQNSLDARSAAAPDLPVVVRIGRGTAANGGAWLDGLAPHLAAAKPGGVAGTKPTAAVPFIVVEDFQTRGLVGDPAAGFESEFAENSRQDFYYFWRNVGRTSKRKGERGSWGLGKAVYPKNSNVNAFFGYSVPETGAHNLMGQVVVPIHSMKVGGEQHNFSSHGYFGRFGGLPTDIDFCLPVESADALLDFRKTFGLTRHLEPGLSVVIPHPDEELLEDNIGDQLLAAVIHHYAFPIIAGDLEVSLEGFGEPKSVSRSNVAAVVKSLSWEKIGGGTYSRERAQRLLELSQEYVDKKTSRFEFQKGTSAAPRWEDLQISEEKMAEASAAFADGKAVTFRVPLTVRTPLGSNAEDAFEVSLQKRQASADSHVEFIRQGLAISEVGGAAGPGIVGIVHIDDGHLAELLRDAENPAHTKWIKKSERLKQWYGGQTKVDFVRDAPRVLAKKLAGEAAAVDKTFLSEFFPILGLSGPKAPGGSPAKVGTPKDPTTVIGPIPPPKPRALALSQIESGFSLRSTGQAKRPKSVNVELAFDTISGNCFKAWSHWDFDLGDPKSGISIEVSGGQKQSAAGNKITFSVDSDDFVARVSGFDTSRDLSVRWKTDNDDEADNDNDDVVDGEVTP